MFSQSQQGTFGTFVCLKKLSKISIKTFFSFYFNKQELLSDESTRDDFFKLSQIHNSPHLFLPLSFSLAHAHTHTHVINRHTHHSLLALFVI
uniref:Uncharacterized protein n=1 Tax=Octopus bimaculoides TaxID=37653 RepID=A0A0L8FQR3_OCTBM